MNSTGSSRKGFFKGLGLALAGVLVLPGFSRRGRVKTDHASTRGAQATPLDSGRVRRAAGTVARGTL